MRAVATRRSFLTGLTVLLLPWGGASAQAPPKMTVSKDPLCGCCTAWIERLRASGFMVEVIETSEMNRVKARLGVPQDLASCHTAELAGYVIEGHVPVDPIKRLLIEKPAARGLAVPGMPVGSLGMEVPGVPPDTYDVVLFGDGKRTTFARYQGARAI